MTNQYLTARDRFRQLYFSQPEQAQTPQSGGGGGPLGIPILDDILKGAESAGAYGLEKFGDFTREIDEAPVTSFLPGDINALIHGDVKGFFTQENAKKDAGGVPKLGDPKRITSQYLREKIPGAAGRVAGATAETVLDPLNIIGVGLAGKATGARGLALELAGRGSMSIPRYASTLALAGVGSGVGKEVAGGPGALVGGFLAPWSAASVESALHQGSLRNAGHAMGEQGRINEGLNSQFSDTIKSGGKSRYETVRLEDGSSARLVTQRGLQDQIGSRSGVSSRAERGLFPDSNFDLNTYKENTSNLESLLRYMQETGRQELVIPDEFDVGRKLGQMYQAQGDTLNWHARAEQTSLNLASLEDAASKLPGFRFKESVSGTPAQVMRTELPNTIESDLSKVAALRRQLSEGGQSVELQKGEVAKAKASYDAKFKEIIDSLPSGAKSAGRRYMSALINDEDPEQALSLLRAKAPEVDPAQFDQALQLHQTRKVAESDLTNLTSSQQSLSSTIKKQVSASDTAIQNAYGSGASSLARKIIKIGNSPADYRLSTLTVKDGKLALVLDRIQPRGTAEEAIRAGGEFDLEANNILRSAQEKEADLRRQLAAAKDTKNKAEYERLRPLVKDAAEEVKRAKMPARPVPISALPKAEKRLVIPMDANVNLKVFEPQSSTPAKLVEAGYKDPRTVSMLNKHTQLTLETESLQNKIQAAKDEMARIHGEVTPSEAEQVLLQQGVIDGVRPEVIKSLQTQSNLREQIQGWESQLGLARTDLSGIEQSMLRSQQTLEATLNRARLEHQTAIDNLTQAEQSYARYQQQFEESLNLGADNIARAQVESFKNYNEAVMNWVKGDLPKKRLSQAALDRYQSNLTDALNRARTTFPKPQQEALAQQVNLIERLIPHQGMRSAIRTMIEPHMRAEKWIDPDAIRSGPMGFINRNILGSGFKSREFDALAATYLDGKAAAGHIADLNYGGHKILTDQYVSKNLAAIGAGTDEAAATARALSKLSPAEQTSAYLRQRVKLMDSKEWSKVLNPLREAGMSEHEVKQVYDLFADEFTHAARHPELYNLRDDPTFSLMTKQFGDNLKELERASKSNRLPANLLRREFREARPTGRLSSLDPEAAGMDLPSRSEYTDAAEVLRNAANSNKNVRAWLLANQSLPDAIRGGSPETVFNLKNVFVDKQDWSKVIPANMLERMNRDGVFEYQIKPKLKDPTQIDKLKRGQDISHTEWKDPQFAEDWSKMKGFLNEAKPTGMWATVEDVRRGVQRIVGSVLIGDLSMLSVQTGFLAAVSPTAAGRALANMWKYAKSDEGFMAWYMDPGRFDNINYAIRNGLGVGSGTVFGGNKPGNIWEMVPGLRKVGRGLNVMDEVMFDRGMFMVKYEALNTNLQTIQMLKAMGKDTAQDYIDGIPVLKDLHSKADIWQSSNEEMYRAAIRLTNNQFGGLPESQSLVSPDRQRVESILFMVPGFFRARSGLINQASRALRNPGSAEGLLATSLIAREAAFRMFFGGAIASVSGTLPEYLDEVKSWEAVDPRKSGGVFTGPIGDGGYLGLSWGNQAPKLYAQMLLGLRSGEFNLKPADRVQALKEFMTGRQNPALRAIVEQYEGKDFFGRPLATPADRAVSMTQTILPIWGSEAADVGLQQIQKDGKLDPASLAANSGAQFIGLNYRPKQPFEILDNKFAAWQAEKYPGEPALSWSDAPAAIRNMAKEMDPSIAKAEENWIYDLNQRAGEADVQVDQAYNQYESKQAEYDQRLSLLSARVDAGQMSLEDWRTAYAEINSDRAMQSEFLQERLAGMGRTLGEKQAPSEGPQVAQALLEYRTVRPESFVKTNPDGSPITRFTDGGPVIDSDIDWNAYRQAQQEALSHYSPAVQDEVKNTLAPKEPLAIRLEQARSDLDTYFDEIPKYVGTTPDESHYVDFVVSTLRGYEDQVRSSLPPGATLDRQSIYRMGLSYLIQNGKVENQKQAQLAAMGMQFALNSSLAQKARNPQSLEWLITHPDLFRWYSWLGSELPRKLNSLLPSDVTATDFSGIQDRELRGTDLASIQ